MSKSRIETSTSKDLYDYFNNILNKDPANHKTQNDVCTPIECIQEMMTKIPESFWESSQEKRILDPCCGNGNFHAVIYWMIKERYPEWTHQQIMRNLYFNDTNPVRLENIVSVFGKESIEQTTQMDFLSEDYSQEQFDMVVLNPPYAKLLEDGKRASKNHNMISGFINKSLDLLRPGGFLVAITPDNWMSYADRNDLAMQLTSYQIWHLNIHTAKRHFPKVGSSFTWYVIQKCEPIAPIHIEGIWKKRHYVDQIACMTPRRYIPLLYDHIVQSILEKTLDLGIEHPRFQIETSSDLHKYTKAALITAKVSEKNCHRLIHTPKQTVWASRAHKYQAGYKVFISLTDRYQVFIDRDCGMTQSIAFIRCDERQKDAELIKRILDHPLYAFLNNICRWGNFNNVRILQRFPIPVNYDDVYGSFGITEEEQRYIEANL